MPGIANAIRSGVPLTFAELFASIIAWRSEPAPLLLVFVTVKVAASAVEEVKKAAAITIAGRDFIGAEHIDSQ